jgi:hypothetical protein
MLIASLTEALCLQASMAERGLRSRLNGEEARDAPQQQIARVPWER